MSTRFSSGARRAAALAAVVALATSPCVAQHEDRRQLRDHEARDAAYLERLERASRTTAADETDPKDTLIGALDAAKLRRARAGELELVTDDPRVDLEAIAALLNGMDALAAATPLPSAPRRSRGTLVLASSSYPLRRAVRDPEIAVRGREPLRLRHDASDLLAVHTDDGDAAALVAAIADLAAHRIVDRRLDATDRVAPSWLGDGLAHYLAMTFRDRGGRFRAGLVGGSSTRPFLRLRAGDSGQLAAVRLRHVRRTWRAAARGDGSLVDALLGDAGDPDAARYGLGWGLVHGMLHGDDGIHAGAFGAWVAGDGGDDLLAALDTSAPVLERMIARHVSEMRAHPRIRATSGAGARLRATDCRSPRRR